MVLLMGRQTVGELRHLQINCSFLIYLLMGRQTVGELRPFKDSEHTLHRD